MAPIRDRWDRERRAAQQRRAAEEFNFDKRTPEEMDRRRAQVQKLSELFRDTPAEVERRSIREAYGMTPEALAEIPDAKTHWQQAGKEAK